MQNDPGIQQSLSGVIEFSIRLFSFFSAGEAADSSTHEACFIKTRNLGPEAIGPDSFGESRRDGPSKPVGILLNRDDNWGGRGLGYSVETMVDHGFGES